MQVSLELSGHPKANVQQVVLHDSTIVGRSRECGLQIASSTVSRKHCEIRIKGSKVSVLDLGSSNGTFIDAERIPAGEERVLQTGGRLNIGGVRFIVSYGESAVGEKDKPSGLEVSGSREEGGVTAAAELHSEPEIGVPLPAEGQVAADEPILADEPLRADDDPILLSDGDDEDVVSASESDFDISIALDSEPEPASKTSEGEPNAATRAMETELLAVPADDDDEPIIEVDEDQALAFLNDDDELSK